jgi:hypothetical protein
MRINAVQSPIPFSFARLTGTARAGGVDSPNVQSSADQLDLSNEGKVLASSLQNEPSSLIHAGDGVRIENVQENYEKNLSAVQARIERVLTENSLPSTDEIRLQIGFDGRLIVAGDHPQKQQIEQLLGSEPGLRNEFALVSSQASLLKAANEAIAFQAAYRKDPIQAVAEFSHLFQQPRPDSVFQLSFLNGEFKTLIETAG